MSGEQPDVPMQAAHETEDSEDGDEQEHAPERNGEQREQSGEGRGEPRRRRRGRRGGRRNRRDREPNSEQREPSESGVRQPYIMDGDIVEATPTPRIEPVEVGQELDALIGDAGRPSEPVVEPVSHRTPERPVMPAEAEQPPSPPKRRSTVREPAPVFTTGQGFTPTPPPQPQASESAASPAEESSDDEGKPRKTGWWAKRILGQ